MGLGRFELPTNGSGNPNERLWGEQTESTPPPAARSQPASQLPAARSVDTEDFPAQASAGIQQIQAPTDPARTKDGGEATWSRKPGRPPVRATWFEAVARTMSDGAPLRGALQHHGITVDKSQIRALYRNKEFRSLYQEERHRHSPGSQSK